jgi:hypothetical protein
VHASGISPFELPICIGYRPSRAIFALVCTLHAGGLLALHLANLPAWIAALGATVVIASLIRFVAAYLRESILDPPPRLELNGRDQWLLDDRHGSTIRLEPCAEQFVHPLLILLRLSGPDGRIRVFPLAPDNCPPDTLRRLRVRLRFPAGPGDGRARRSTVSGSA